LSVTGSGDIELNHITAENIKARVTGSGDIDLSGATQSADYAVSGSGDIDAVRLEAGNVVAGVSGSGDISCYAVSALKAHRSGSGSISYKGNPQQVDAPHKGVYRF
jgi:N-acetylmuramic acid 6-phosphate (MurNAc-6-P) etherase